MPDIRITSQFTVEGDGDLDRHTDELIASLVEVERADRRFSQGDVAIVLREKSVQFSLVVRAANWAEAEALGETAITRAIENAGGSVLEEDAPLKSGASDHLNASLRSTELVPA